MARARDEGWALAAEQAAMWLEKLERTITKEEGVALRQWLKQSLHRDAIVERCKLWHGPEILAVLGELIPVESLSDRAARRADTMVIAVLFAVSMIGVVTIGFALSRIWSNTDERGNPLRAIASVETGVGERKTLELPDGSSIIMNTRTRLQLRYMPHSRSVTLLAGEATFDAKHDPERPFMVFAGSRALEVVQDGTAFNVYKLDDEHAELTVLRGQVKALESRSPEPIPPALLRARVHYGAHVFEAGTGGVLGAGWQQPRALSPPEVEGRVAWHRGIVVFENELLEEALRELERYSDNRFRLAHGTSDDVRVSGRFDARDSAEFLRYLREHYMIASRPGSIGQIELSRLKQ